MAFGWSKTRYSPIAVDFGADSLKLLQVLPTDPPQLVAAAAAPVPEEARTTLSARLAFYSEALRDLLRGQPFKGRRAVCTIPSSQTLVQHLQIGRSEHDDIAAQIGLQLRQRLSVDPARMVVRHFEVAQVVRDNAPKHEVVCFAASRDTVLQHIEAAKRAKLDIVGMQCEPIAILKAFEHLYRRETDAQRVTCFIDLGAATTKAVIAHGARMVFAKTIHVGGDHFTRHYAEAQGLGFTEAREARMRDSAGAANAAAAPDPAEPTVAAPVVRGGGGLAVLEAQIAAEQRTAAAAPPAPPAPPARPAPRTTPAHPAADDAADTLECLTDELQMCVRYHQSLFPGRTIEKLVFLGGESRNVGTCQKIARSLRIGAQLGEPLARLMRLSHNGSVGVDLRQPQPGWAVPMGLALCDGEI